MGKNPSDIFFGSAPYGPENTVFKCNMLVYQVIIRSISLVLVILSNTTGEGEHG